MFDFKSLRQVDSCLFNFSRQFHWNVIYKSNAVPAAQSNQVVEYCMILIKPHAHFEREKNPISQVKPIFLCAKKTPPKYLFSINNPLLKPVFFLSLLIFTV